MKKILMFFWIFMLFIANTFAFEAKLDAKTDSLNNIVNLNIEIKTSEWWEIKVKDIKWIENFQIVWQSQSQSSSSSVVIINWKTKQKSITTVNLNLQLQPKKSWSFEIGPATILMWTWSVKTNSVLVKIDKNNLNILWNNTKTQIIQNNKNNKINTKNNVSKNINNISNKNEKQEKINLEDYKNNNYELYILIGILILSGIWFYILFNKKSEKILPLQRGDAWKAEGDKKIKETENFEEKPKKIIYPKITDENFIENITDIFKEKLAKKYNIDNIKSKTFSEILDEISLPLKGGDAWKAEGVSEIVNLINKAKYSNIITNNEKILEEVKKIK